ncbi:extracellular solute-binding protein [Ruminococcaceae bacterium OttesenSCG-928-A16]|nr:extracellular solute-binding protein [Ruminococcaceae bacterium OttesenSCG-928-A16]
MKKANKSLAFIVALLLLCSMLAACSGGASSASSAASQNSAGGGSTEPTGAVTINAARPIPDDLSFPDGDTMEENIWTRLYESELGIQLNYIWTTPVAQYDQKLNISITSGDLPDIFQVNATQLKQLVDDGQLADLTDVFSNTATAYTQDVMNSDGGNALLSATFDGKLMAIPKMGSGIGNSNVLWIRTDWLEALGMDAPKNMEELLDLARAFTNNDPDGNGQKDTYGLALNKDLWGMFASVEGLFNGFGAYPNMWVEKDGSLESGNIQPEMKNALQALQNLYKEGCIDPEFGVKDGFKVSEDVSQNKLGIMYGFFWNMGWLTDAKTANPDMEWKAYSIVGEGSDAALVQVPFAVDTYFVVSAACAHPEAAVQMLNLQLEKTYGESAEPDKYNVDTTGNPIFEYPLIYCEPPMKNLDAQVAVTAALDSGDTTALNAEQMGYYEQIVSYREGNEENWAACWGAEMMYGPEGSLAVLNEYMNGKAYNNRYFGPSTTTMTQADAVLNQSQLQVFTEIIMGGDIAKFDQYVTDWKSLGGDTITEEVNQWNSER